MGIRRADLAGAWYPGGELDCRRTVERFLDADLPCPGDTEDMVGGIVPHAGWVFSGEIACNVIKCLSAREPDTCVVFGRHLHRTSASFIMEEGRWETPLGELEVDADLARCVTKEFPFSVETTSRYEEDNTIEVQLPFIKYFLPDAKIVPMGLPPNTTSLEAAKRTVQIAREMGRETVVLGSTDLTHYGNSYGYTPKGTGKKAVEWVKNVNDKRAVDLMVNMDETGVINESFMNHNLCCPGAVAAAIVAARELGAGDGKEVKYSTSYDVRPDSSFVGYVGLVFLR